MNRESSRYDKLESMLEGGSSKPHNVPLKYLRNITNNFSDERLLGLGGFGTVYKGVLQNGETIAVKKLNSSIPGVRDRQFDNEANHLMRLKHPNVVVLVGWCFDKQNTYVEYNGKLVLAENSERLLCLEYMPKGNLREYVSDEFSGLGWDTRYKIIEGICSGLCYLHEQCQPIVHMDLKPANILLDNNMVPKIADFGLSRLFSQEKTWTHTISRDGTLGYMSPEYINRGLISTKSDIFSLGVIIMEIVTGRRDYPDDTGTPCEEFIETVLHNWSQRKGMKILFGVSLEVDYQQIRRCIQIGLDCVKTDRSKRPTISQIIKALHRPESADSSNIKGVRSPTNIVRLAGSLTKNPFDLRRNRDGVIQMGLAENQLSLDLIEQWSMEHPEASICTAQGASEFRRIANFQDYHGLPEFREAMAKFMGQVRGGKVKFDPDRVVMSGGATGAQDTLAFCLADPGDAYLVPTPYYPAFDRDCCWTSGVKLLSIECHSANNFTLTREALVSAYDDARRQGIRVKGILITNPSNPLGTIMDRGTLAMLATFATEHRVHLICDEIYAGSVFAKPDFVSIAEVIEHDVPGCNRDLIHIAYSLSKDFGLPGFRVGIVYSYNDDVMACARKMSSFGLVSSQTQHFLAKMLSDAEFMARFLAESARRLAARHERFIAGLREVGIACLPGNAGLFLWMDLRRMLRDETHDAELELWRVIIHEVKLNVSPGTSFHCNEPGWFRVCHANMDDETLEVALARIRRFVRQHQHQHQQRKAKAERWAARPLRLSLPRRGGATASHLAISSRGLIRTSRLI